MVYLVRWWDQETKRAYHEDGSGPWDGFLYAMEKSGMLEFESQTVRLVGLPENSIWF